MDAKTLFDKYSEVKKEKLEKSNTLEDVIYLNGWVDCLRFVLNEMEK